MKMDSAVDVLTRELKDELVLTNIATAARSLYCSDDRDKNLYGISMGQASSMGLGLALALPTKKIVVLDGDGSLLMNLGSLATIANEDPPNLVLIVWDNECYQGPGGLASATAGKTDLRAIAQGAGIKNSVQVNDLEGFTKTIKQALTGRELFFIVAKVEKEEKSKRPRMGLHKIENTYRFLRALRDEGLINGWHE